MHITKVGKENTAAGGNDTDKIKKASAHINAIESTGHCTRTNGNKRTHGTREEPESSWLRSVRARSKHTSLGGAAEEEEKINVLNPLTASVVSLVPRRQKSFAVYARVVGSNETLGREGVYYVTCHCFRETLAVHSAGKKLAALKFVNFRVPMLASSMFLSKAEALALGENPVLQFWIKDKEGI
ncbi:hypothetical protein MRX96_020216 [Rhipicephalus microplus]